jgi:hypothetical protein
MNWQVFLNGYVTGAQLYKKAKNSWIASCYLTDKTCKGNDVVVMLFTPLQLVDD